MNLPTKPVVGEATAIRQIAAEQIPPQDTSAMDELVERYSRPDRSSARGGDRGD